MFEFLVGRSMEKSTMYLPLFSSLIEHIEARPEAPQAGKFIAAQKS